MRKEHTSYNRFAFYHQDEGMLFQFYLHECLQTYRLVQNHPDPANLRALLGEYPLVASAVYFFEKGFNPRGRLEKLKVYHSLLLVHFSNSNRDEKLELLFNEMLASAGECRAPFEQDEKIYIQLFIGFREKIKAIATCIIDRVLDYPLNETLCFFLLSYHAEIDALYKEPIVHKRLSSFFSGGMKGVESYLSEQYERGGFHHLIPIIQGKVEALAKKGSLHNVKKGGE